MRKLFCVFLLLAACSKQNYSMAPQSEQFDSSVSYNNKVDVLMMVDNSSSMTTYQNRLIDQTQGMIDVLNQLGMDYHIAVVTSDLSGSKPTGGKFVSSTNQPAVLKNSTPNLKDVLKLKIAQGSVGSDLEEGLESIKKALSLTNPNLNDFLRSEALLAVVALTNEDDYSRGTADEYIKFFNEIKPDFPKNGNFGGGKAWMMNFIGVTSLDSKCSTSLGGDYKETGKKWISIAEASNGRKESICESSLANAVSNIQQRIIQVLTDFKLDRKPKKSTIVVKINNQVIPENPENGWEYLEIGSDMIVRFHGTSIPTANAKISVAFDPAESR